MTITLTPHTEEQLRETARREGQDIDILAEAILAESLALRARQFDEDVKAIQEGLDAVDQGRVRPFREFMAEHRRLYPDPAPGA